MSSTVMPVMPKLQRLPAALPLEGAVRIELQQGVPIFKASRAVQERLETLLEQQQTSGLTATEEEELDRYEEMDDYLSFVNRTVRNLVQTTSGSDTTTGEIGGSSIGGLGPNLLDWPRFVKTA